MLPNIYHSLQAVICIYIYILGVILFGCCCCLVLQAGFVVFQSHLLFMLAKSVNRNHACYYVLCVHKRVIDTLIKE
jgi:hypothetical protein